MQSVSQLLQQGAKELEELELPRLEAILLLSHSSGISKEKLLAMRTDELSEKETLAFLDLVRRRKAGEPSAYIIGYREFYGRKINVTPDVLIPRPDTETLVEEALSLIRFKINNRLDETEKLTVLDLCTGSGAVILSLAAELKQEFAQDHSLDTMGLHFMASDISNKALLIAKANWKEYHLPIDSFEGDLLQALPDKLKLDIIATNPPYLTDEESDEKIQEGWREPDLALRAGENGLDLIEKIIEDSVDRLKQKGYLLIEAHGPQMNAIECLLMKLDFVNIRKVKDLAGIQRVIIGQKK